MYLLYFFFFFFNDTATTEIYTLSLHDALPISCCDPASILPTPPRTRRTREPVLRVSNRRSPKSGRDRKSTRLNSSHSQISYAVFCLKKKKKNTTTHTRWTKYHTTLTTST